MANIFMGAIALGLCWAMTTIGVYLTYRVLDIADLTVEGSIVLGASVAALVIYQGGSPILATIAAFVAGTLAGMFTALLHIGMKIPPLLAGILSMIAFYSINIRVMMDSSNLSLLRLPTIFSPLTDRGMSKNAAGIIVAGACSLLVIALVYWFLNTEIGYTLRATGDSPKMASAQGINTNRAKLIGYMLSNGLVGLSGGLIAQYLGFSDVQMGTGSIVIGLASLFIGEVLFSRKGGVLRSLIGLVLGSVVYRIIIALVFEAGMRATDLKLFTALTVAIALYLPHVKEDIGKVMKKRKGETKHAKNR